MEDRLSFSKIHIIEWLKPANRQTGEDGDRRTGEETYRELKTLIPASGSRMDVILHRVSSRATFIKRLGRIEEDFRASRKVPLLQIETHGDDDNGIGPSEDDGLTWPELMEALTPLNLATGVRLPVVLAACHGIWGIKMAQPMERSPFLALLGPNRKVYPGEVVRGMRAFYRGIFEHKDGSRAVQMLNNIVDPDKTTFGIFNCEQLFRDVWEGYFADAMDERWIAARVEHAAESAKAKRPRSESELADLRVYMRNYILDHPARFEESRRHFFMIDLYPENAARFNLMATPAPAVAPVSGA